MVEGADTLTDRHGRDIRVEGGRVAANALVTRDEGDRHLEHGGGEAVHDELGGSLAVDREAMHLQGKRMGEGIAVAPGLGVIPQEHDRIEAFVELLHHAEGMAAPGPNEAHAFRQPCGDDVAAAAMGVLDDDLIRPGSDRSFAGRDHLGGHRLAELRICRVLLARFLPVGDAGDTFDIGTDIDFHLAV